MSRIFNGRWNDADLGGWTPYKKHAARPGHVLPFQNKNIITIMIYSEIRDHFIGNNDSQASITLTFDDRSPAFLRRYSFSFAVGFAE